MHLVVVLSLLGRTLFLEPEYSLVCGEGDVWSPHLVLREADELQGYLVA